MEIPKGFKGYFLEDKVIKLNILIYSLKQAVRAFYK